MNIDRDASITDDCFVTASQIFEFCGVEGGGTLQVDALMEKLVKTIPRAEYSYMKSLLDPTESNPEINVEKLAWALNQYTDAQKIKEDFEESFNSKNGPVPQDSDSGISTDAGFQLIEELQSQLREKSHLARQLRGQLDFADRQHEDAIATIQAERDSIRNQMQMLREENASLSHIRADYVEAAERVYTLERQLQDAKIDVETLKKLIKTLKEQIEELENEKSALNNKLVVSVSECHRMNELYASRQTALREDNDLLRARYAELHAKLVDNDDYVQQLIKDKVILEMELKEMLNKQNQSAFRMDRSIEVSYTEDQMLSALDPLAADSQFSMENKILDEESFICALKEDQGRATNISLFDEIRYSLSNASRHTVEFDEKFVNFDNLDSSLVTAATQTDEHSDDTYCSNCDNNSYIKQPVVTKTIPSNIDKKVNNVETQTDELKCRDSDNNNCGDCNKCLQCEKLNSYKRKLETDLRKSNDLAQSLQSDLDAYETRCEKLNTYRDKLENDLRRSNNLTQSLQSDLEGYEKNLTILQKFLDEGNVRNNMLQIIVNDLQKKIGVLETVVAGQRDDVDKIDRLSCDTCNAECQTHGDQSTVSTQADAPCVDCEKRKAVVPQRGVKKYLWDPLKYLFQVFAVICFAMSVCVLYGVTRRWNARCDRDTQALPWKWIDTNDLMDLLLRIEYVADVPM